VSACAHAGNCLSINIGVCASLVDQNPRVPDVARVWAESKEQKDQWVQSIRKVLTRFQEGTESKALNLRPVVTTVRGRRHGSPMPSAVCSSHLQLLRRVAGRVSCARCVWGGVGGCYSHEPCGQRRKAPPRATKREAAAAGR